MNSRPPISIQAPTAPLDLSSPQRLHVIGVGGPGMSAIAIALAEMGHAVSGSDLREQVVLDRVRAAGVMVHVGHDPVLVDGCDAVTASTAIPADNIELTYAASIGIPTLRRAGMLASICALARSVAVAGTHGKTTTTTILAYLLQAAGREPGFLIGGVAEDFGVSARLGRGRRLSSSGALRHPQSSTGQALLPEEEGIQPLPSATRSLFVVEADEYDTAFFDKRSKFVHYRPLVAILNNLEFDHADIFPDVAAIQRQFHHLVRTVPACGRLIVNGEDEHLVEVLAMGCWTPVERFGFDDSFEWSVRLLVADGSAFVVRHRGADIGTVQWPLLGRHNVMNALAALAACHAVGVVPVEVMPALARFRSVKRRLEVIGDADGITVYDDFAHHPTAIATTLAGLRAKVGAARIVVAMEPRSNSMRLGAHADALAPSLGGADAVVFLRRPELAWDADKVIAALRGAGRTAPDVDALIALLREVVRDGDHVVFMSNGGFDGAPRRFLAALQGELATD